MAGPSEPLPSGVTVVTGPVRSGKTRLLLAEYERCFAGQPIGGALWLSPTPGAAAAMGARLLGAGQPAQLRPACFTFDQFAATVARSSGVQFFPMADFDRRELIRAAAALMAEAGKLIELRPLLDQPGLLDLVCQSIDGLRRRGITAVQFADACHTASRRDREFAQLYSRFERACDRHGLADSAKLLAIATQQIRQGFPSGFEHLECVFVDGFATFTDPQLDLLSALAERVGRLAISLPLEEPLERTALFGPALRTLEALRARFADMRVVAIARAGDAPPDAASAGLKLLEANFAAPAHKTPVTGPPGGVEIVETSGAEAELGWLARAVKTLLCQGEQAAGVPVAPADILVVDAALESRSSAVRQAFEEYGIPTELDAPRPLAHMPPLGLLLTAVRLERDDWPLRGVLALLGSSMLAPRWREWKDGRAAVAADEVVRRIGRRRGGDELLRIVERWATKGPPAGTSRRAAHLRSQAELALPLIRRLALALSALPREATAANWCKALQSLSQEFGLPCLAPVEREAWRRLETALRAADRAATWLGGTPQRMSLGEICGRFEQVLGRLPAPVAPAAAARVRVLTLAAARGLSARYVFVTGLGENAFASMGDEDRFLSPAQINRLIRAGPPLVARDEKSAEIWLAIYELLAGARHRLWLSFPALDEQAQPLLPSPYLLEADRACGRPARRRHTQLSPIPPADEPPLGARDFRVAAVARALEGDSHLLGGFAGVKALRPAARNLLAALGTAHERASGRGFGAFEGVLPAGDALAPLATRYGADHVWSVSELQQYGECPYKFFLERVLKLDPLKDSVLSTDVLGRGSRAHETLAEMHLRIGGRAGQPSSPCEGGPQRLAGEYHAALDELRQTYCSEQSLEAALVELDLRAVEQWLSGYYKQYQQYEDKLCGTLGEPLLPTYFEVGFGEGAHRGAMPAEENRGLSRAEPFELNCGSEVVRFSGRIDRIDVGQVDGRTVFNIVDYKSGNSKSPSTAEASPLQLALYTLVVREMLLKHQAAVPWAAAYWFLKDDGYEPRMLFGTRDAVLAPNALAEQLESELVERVKATLEPLRRGEFPMFNSDPKCTSRCDFRTVCRVTQTRALGKEWAVVETSDAGASPQSAEADLPDKDEPSARGSQPAVSQTTVPQPLGMQPKKRRRSRQS